MARAQIEAALGELGNISTFVGMTPLTATVFTATTLTLMDADGDGFTFSGTGLTYSQAGGVTGGTFTDILIFSHTGATLETITDFSRLAKQFYQIYQFGGIAAGVFDLFKANDQITGSSIGDQLIGFSGNDTIRGGTGNDIIGGSAGRDKLSGQGGADIFIFVKGDGKDTILDFTDTGGAMDDRIALTTRMHNLMTVEETLTGVTLHFGAIDRIIVNHWHAADVGISDFVLS